MKEYNWSDRYSVNIKEIDLQHQRLLAIMAELHAAMLEKKSKAILEDIYAKLIVYTQEHFAYEEGLMQKFDYPAYQDHKRNHDQLRAKVLGMQRDHGTGKIVMSITVMEFLVDWLKKHIMGCDFLYKNFFHGEGVR